MRERGYIVTSWQWDKNVPRFNESLFRTLLCLSFLILDAASLIIVSMLAIEQEKVNCTLSTSIHAGEVLFEKKNQFDWLVQDPGACTTLCKRSYQTLFSCVEVEGCGLWDQVSTLVTKSMLGKNNNNKKKLVDTKFLANGRDQGSCFNMEKY